MWILLVVCFFIAVAGAPFEVIGHRGEKVDIKCSYESGYETNLKYFCKGMCIPGSKVIMVESGSPAKDERFSLTDDTTNRVFTVTITDLRTEDGGQYWCVVKRTLPDVYSEALLLVKEAVVGAPVEVIGHRREKVDIKCPYESGYETYSKYLCKGECKPQSKVIMVESGFPAKDERFSLTDDTTNRVFTITITDLRTEDGGQYWCVVKGRKFDGYSAVLLLVKEDSLVIIITSAGVVLVLVIAVVFITLAIRKKKQTSGLVSGLDLTSQTAEENPYERGDRSVPPNSHTDENSAVHRITVDSNTEINMKTAATDRLNSDQIYTELNSSRMSHVYHTLTETTG